MGQAMLGSWEFRVDPNTIEWDFRVKVSESRTLGGKVIQVLGVQIGDMRVEGAYGVGGREEQQDFVSWFRDTARAQADTPPAPLVDFMVPQRNWHFKVYLRSLLEGQRSINLDVSNFSPKFSLTLLPSEDRSKYRVAKAAERMFINRISKDFGWERTKYNGPMTAEEVQATLDGRDVRDYLAEAYSPYLTPPPVGAE